jgi:NADPH:quinone reductase-like Zn-dependent oxidoreductase
MTYKLIATPADDQFRDGAAAEYLAVEARNVARKRTTVDHAHAAAVPMAGLTAWHGLFGCERGPDSRTYRAW